MARTLTSTLAVELIDRVSATAKRVSSSLKGMGAQVAGVTGEGLPARTRLEAAMARNNAAIERARGGVVDAAAAFYTLKAAIGAPVQAAMDFESAMADVRKVVDFPTPEGLG